MKCVRNEMISLSRHACCFSVNPWRQAFQRRIFAERGLSFPAIKPPIRVSAPTHAGEPRAYSGLALNFIERLLEAHAQGLPYCVIYEDDAYPCSNPQEKLNSILSSHPLPADCGILCLGDINGVSRYRGKQTLLLHQCSAPYTQLVPSTAENKGSHALVVFAAANIPYAQAIAQCGVTDVAISRICRYSDLHAYGLFFDPLFTQHNYQGGKAPSTPHRLPEFFAARNISPSSRFPAPKNQTRLLLPQASRFLVFSNAPNKDLQRADVRDGDVLVFLNKAVDFEHFARSNNPRLLISRSKAGHKGEWFLPTNHADHLSTLYDDFLLLSDDALAAERPWYGEYKEATGGKIPTTGWITYRLLRDHYPTAEIELIGFNPAGENGCYKWPRHAWQYEAQYYRDNNVKH